MMNRIGKQILAATYLTLACLASQGCAKPEGVSVGNKAPELSFENARKPGEVVSLKSLEGKVVLIEFWATWCGPCIDIMPMVERLHRDYKEQGLAIVSISNEARGTVENFLKKSSHTYPVYLDRDDSVNAAFQIQTIPHAVLIGRDGTILFAGPPGGPIEEKIREALKG